MWRKVQDTEQNLQAQFKRTIVGPYRIAWRGERWKTRKPPKLTWWEEHKDDVKNIIEMYGRNTFIRRGKIRKEWWESGKWKGAPQ